jgi:hypothetical protein
MIDLIFFFLMQLFVVICYSETFPSALLSKDNPLVTTSFEYYLKQKSKDIVGAGAPVDTRNSTCGIFREENWHEDMSFPEFLCFPLSVSFHKCSTFIHL